ncbi:MAG: methyltransferase domain-containing protein, partial [Rhizonema sp. PD38]|nr:methyltransferase domain-containing protein [Rhizonema sp. PD38]
MSTSVTKLGNFANVDQSANPNYFIHYLDNVSSLEVVQAAKRQTYSLLEVCIGEHILDVGCGTGSDVRALAKIVGNTGLVVGVDFSETMIQEAQKRNQGLDLAIKYQQGDVYNLEFQDNTFDACRTDRLFHFLDNPTKALNEMLRITRPGGRIVISEPDWGTLV